VSRTLAVAGRYIQGQLVLFDSLSVLLVQVIPFECEGIDRGTLEKILARVEAGKEEGARESGVCHEGIDQ
jgi:hypothetical protein